MESNKYFDKERLFKCPECKELVSHNPQMQGLTVHCKMCNVNIAYLGMIKKDGN